MFPQQCDHRLIQLDMYCLMPYWQSVYMSLL